MVHLPFSSVSSTHSSRFTWLCAYITLHYFSLLSCRVCLSTHFYCSIHSISILLCFLLCVHAIQRNECVHMLSLRWKSANRRRMFHRHTIIVCARARDVFCDVICSFAGNGNLSLETVSLVIQWWYDWHSNDEQIPQCDHLDDLAHSRTHFTPKLSAHTHVRRSYLYHHHHFEPSKAIFRVNSTNEAERRKYINFIVSN